MVCYYAKNKWFNYASDNEKPRLGRVCMEMKKRSTLDFDALRPPAAGLTAEHDAWRQTLRRFVDSEIAPHIDEWDRACTFPDSLYNKAAQAGLLGMGFPESLGGNNENADLYHRIIMGEELHRLGSGVVFAELATHWIGLPPVVSQANPELNDEVVRPVLAGDKKIAFAVTEPGGGSDVSRIETTAEKNRSGWLVSGEKTLVSGVMRADYILTAVRTGGRGMGGLSLLLIDTSLPGIQREPLEGLKWYNSAIGSVSLNSVQVPDHCLIGDRDQGFRALAGQFNIERFSGVAAALAMGRVSVAQALAFARQREVFGKRLIDHQAMRHKLVDLVRALRVAYAYLDQCVWRFERGEEVVADLCMLKIHATTTLEHCSREALHVLGGTAYHGSARIERIFRESRIFAVGGGTEEVLRDLAGRQMQF
jgi:acyl-CoA dehydrogenase